MPLPSRRSIRLSSSAYRRPGAYFITVCTADRRRILGDCSAGIHSLSSAGVLVEATLREVSHHWPAVALDAWVVMPDHLHAILIFHSTVLAGLPQVVGSVKSAASKLIRSKLSDV